MIPSQAFEVDYLGWVAPLPKPTISFLSMIEPLDPLVWIGTVVSMIILSIAGFYIASSEIYVQKELDKTKVFESLLESFWLSFGTLLGEFTKPSMQRNTISFIATRYSS